MNVDEGVDYYKNMSFETYESKSICKIVNLNYDSNPGRLFILLWSLLYEGLMFDAEVIRMLDEFNVRTSDKNVEDLNRLDDQLSTKIIERYTIDFANKIHVNYCKCVSEMNGISLLDESSAYLSTEITDKILNSKSIVKYEYQRFCELFDRYFVKPFNMSRIKSTGLVGELILTIDRIPEALNEAVISKIIDDFRTQICGQFPNLKFKIIVPKHNTKVAIMRSLALKHTESSWLIYTDDDDISISLSEFSKLCDAFIIPPKMIYNFSLISIHYYPAKSIQLDGIQTNAVCLMPRLINVDFMRKLDLGNSCRTTTFEDNDVRINEFMKTNFMNLNASLDNKGVIRMNDENSVIYTLRTPAYIYKDPSRRGCHVNDLLMLRLSTYVGINTYFFGNEYNASNDAKLNIKNMIMTHFINMYHFCHKNVDLSNVPSMYVDETEIRELLDKSTNYIREHVYKDIHHPDELIQYTIHFFKGLKPMIPIQKVSFAGHRIHRSAYFNGSEVIYGESPESVKSYSFDKWNEFVLSRPMKLMY